MSKLATPRLEEIIIKFFAIFFERIGMCSGESAMSKGHTWEDLPRTRTSFLLSNLSNEGAFEGYKEHIE